MKPTFKKKCKYCPKIMEVESHKKETCFNCKMRMAREYNKKRYERLNKK